MSKRNLFIGVLGGILLLVISGCAGSTGQAGMSSTDPIERGCSYIAAAIVTNGVLRALFNQ